MTFHNPRPVAVLAAGLLVALLALPAHAGGKVTVSFLDAPDPDLQEIGKVLKESNFFDEIGNAVTAEVDLPRDLPVVVATCQTPNAFYDPENVQVVFCYEMFGLLAQVFYEPEASDEEVGNALLGAAAFIFLHEMGHALVDQLDIPVTGREEDAVDDLATLILLAGNAEDALFAALDSFQTLSDQMETGDVDLPFWDEHSFHAQRVYSIACLIYGSNPEAYAGMVGEEGLPEERAVRCPAEYQQKYSAWDRLLGFHTAGGP